MPHGEYHKSASCQPVSVEVTLLLSATILAFCVRLGLCKRASQCQVVSFIQYDTEIICKQDSKPASGRTILVVINVPQHHKNRSNGQLYHSPISFIMGWVHHPLLHIGYSQPLASLVLSAILSVVSAVGTS